MRTGNKILRQRLRGPTVLHYYPKRIVGIADLRHAWPDRLFIDPAEVTRLEDVQMYIPPFPLPPSLLTLFSSSSPLPLPLTHSAFPLSLAFYPRCGRKSPQAAVVAEVPFFSSSPYV